MTAEFSKSVELGVKLSKRIYYGKDPPERTASMHRKLTEAEILLPTAPMVYAVVTEPSIVDNPDIPSYQPYVHGRCEPPALIPLHMHRVAMEVDCYLDTAFVTVTGSWRLHCVSAGRSCDCRIAVPMGEQGSVLGLEVESPSKSYCTELITPDDIQDAEGLVNATDGLLLKRQIYTLKVGQVDGGSILSLKISWSQRLLYQDGQFCVTVPFSFPPYVNPSRDKLHKKEKILLNVDSATGTEVLCGSASHPLKEWKHQAGKLGFSYEEDVQIWSTNDFNFSYYDIQVPLTGMFGSLLLKSPSLHDFDQREIFMCYLYPGNGNGKKVFRRDVVFIVDLSSSMRGDPLENTKSGLLAALYKLNPTDTFNIIAFNGNSLLFSPTTVLATKEAIQNASEWINQNFIAEGGTNILLPLNQALQMFSRTGDMIPLIFLISDGAVEEEREICDAMKRHLIGKDVNCPRIFTFGIGSYCNHYFLQMLAQIGRGYYDASYDVDSISYRMERLFNFMSIILVDISIDAFKSLDSLELYPLHVPDLSYGGPLVVSGRYHGNFPDSVEVSGKLADLSNFAINVRVQKAKNIPLERVLARRHIDILTAQAWLSGSKQLEHKVSKISLLTGIPSEYTDLILVETKKGKQAAKLEAGASCNKIILLRKLGIGFGNLKATAENLPIEAAEPKLHETSEVLFEAASNCCRKLLDCCCCMCFIRCCGRLNDQCAVVFTQLCAVLSCLECLSVCSEVCCS